MSLDPCFLELSTQVITVQALSTVASRYGAPTFAATSAASTFRAYIDPGSRVIVNEQGVEQVTSATVYVFSSSGAIGVQDRLTLPDGRTPELLRVDVLHDEDGQHHLELMVR